MIYSTVILQRFWPCQLTVINRNKNIKQNFNECVQLRQELLCCPPLLVRPKTGVEKMTSRDELISMKQHVSGVLIC